MRGKRHVIENRIVWIVKTCDLARFGALHPVPTFCRQSPAITALEPCLGPAATAAPGADRPRCTGRPKTGAFPLPP